MIFQPLNKFGIFTFVVSYTICFIVFFSLTGRGNKIFGVWWENIKGEIFKGRRVNHPWMKLRHRGKDSLIKKVFHSKLKENIEETKTALKKLGRLPHHTWFKIFEWEVTGTMQNWCRICRKWYYRKGNIMEKSRRRNQKTWEPCSE